MADERRRIDRFLDPTYAADLEARSLEELRLMKAECVEVETETSYVRRLAQARADIMDAERRRRASGGSVGDLIEALPRILADETRPGAATGRLPQLLAPDPSIEWQRGLEHLIADDSLAKLPLLADHDLRSAYDQIVLFEGEVSEARKDLHEVISRIEDELATRISAAGDDPGGSAGHAS